MRKLAAPYIARLARDTGETIHLSVLDGMDVIYIDKVDSVQPIRAYSMVSRRAPAYAVATGKALLAAEGEAYLARAAKRLERYTPSTIVEIVALKADLAKAARVGYAINRARVARRRRRRRRAGVQRLRQTGGGDRHLRPARSPHAGADEDASRPP